LSCGRDISWVRSKIVFLVSAKLHRTILCVRDKGTLLYGNQFWDLYSHGWIYVKDSDNVISHVKGKKVNQSTCIAPCMVQTTLKRSGMDHTAFNLQRTQCQPLPRKRSPDGASTEWGGKHLIAAHYSFIDPERMKDWVGLKGVFEVSLSNQNIFDGKRLGMLRWIE